MQYAHLSLFQAHHPKFIVTGAFPSGSCSGCLAVIAFAGAAR